MNAHTHEQVQPFLWSDPLMDEAAEAQADTEQLAWSIEEALRECLTHGVSVPAVRLLCYASGISYEVVTGAPR